MIKIIREPKVYLIARPTCHWYGNGMQSFLDSEGVGDAHFDGTPAEIVVEEAGRVCYMSYGKGRKTNKEFIANLINSGHHSVLEHANWTLLLTGISRSLTHEFVRHRHFSYSQLSQRYVDSKDVAFVLPPDLPEKLHIFWEIACSNALDAYNEIVSEMTSWKASAQTTDERKRVRGTARCVLPNCTETKMVVTGNARAWREFFNKRGSIHADVEIRRLAVKILETLQAEAPALFMDYEVQGGCIVKRASGGHYPQSV